MGKNVRTSFMDGPLHYVLNLKIAIPKNAIIVNQKYNINANV